MKNYQKLVESVLMMLDESPTPTSLYVMGMLSDVQEMIQRGQSELAIQCLNEAKIIIDQRLAKKDAEGRHL